MFRRIIEAEKPFGRRCLQILRRKNAVDFIEDSGARCDVNGCVVSLTYLLIYRLLRFDPGFRVSLSKMVNIEQVRAANC